jgi:dimethylargininase
MDTASHSMIAITHVPSPKMEQCERTYVARTPIDYRRAARQHVQYCRMLRACGADVVTLDVNRDLPDCAFVEDTAIVLDEVAVLASMGAESRRAEPSGIELELGKYRDLHRVQPPAMIEGGDVLRVGRKLLVGLSSRTNRAGVDALGRVVCRYGYKIVPVPVRDCLHLKTACTALPDQSLLINPAWFDVRAVHGFELVPVPKGEPWAANVALVGNRVCVAADHVETGGMIRERGYEVHTIDLAEFAKAEGGVTCLSILFRAA